MIVKINRPAVDSDTRILNHCADFFFKTRHRCHTPCFASGAEGIAYLLVLNVEIADFTLGNELLQEFIAPNGQWHILGIRADECVVFIKKQVYAFCNFCGFFGLCQRGFPGFFAATVQCFNPCHSLHGVDAFQRDQARRSQEDGADACSKHPFCVFCKGFRAEAKNAGVAHKSLCNVLTAA